MSEPPNIGRHRSCDLKSAVLRASGDQDSARRSNHDAAFKAREAVEAVKAAGTVPDFAAELGVHPAMRHQRQRSLPDGAAGIFDHDGKAEVAAVIEVETVRDLHAMMGEMAVANDLVSKAQALGRASDERRG